MLDQDQVAAYHRQGFVVVPDFVSAPDRQRLRRDETDFLAAFAQRRSNRVGVVGLDAATGETHLACVVAQVVGAAREQRQSRQDEAEKPFQVPVPVNRRQFENVTLARGAAS